VLVVRQQRKRHPQDWNVYGRLRVNLKESANPAVTNSECRASVLRSMS
jgi:hypothetical protein